MPHRPLIALAVLLPPMTSAVATLDQNAFANDEYTQFMNEVFINAPNAVLPAYELGGASS